jgi:hypothetical protein
VQKGSIERKLVRIRKRQTDGLEDRLFFSRPEPSAEFLASLTTRIREDQPRVVSGLRTARIAFATGLSVVLLGAAAAFGGFAEAVEAAKDAANTLSGNNSQQIQKVTPGQDQYRPGCGRGDKNHIHTGPPGDQQGFDDPCPPNAGPNN